MTPTLMLSYFVASSSALRAIAIFLPQLGILSHTHVVRGHGVWHVYIFPLVGRFCTAELPFTNVDSAHTIV